MHHAVLFNVSSTPNKITMGAATKRSPGAHRIATTLRNEGWDVEVIDYTCFFSLDELKQLTLSRIISNTIFIGFSCFMSHWTKTLEAYTEWLRLKYPEIKIIVGGQSLPRMNTKHIDYYVYGYGEVAILELVKSLIGNTPANALTFDSKFIDKKVISANINYPAYPPSYRLDKIRTIYEKRDFIREDEWLSIEFSRGCIFKCLYCNYPILGVKGDYTRDAEDVYIEFMDNYDRFGVKNYIAADETFNDYTKKVIKFANISEKLPFNPFISGFIRADLLVSRPEDWEHMARLGMLGHFYGIESMHQPTAKAIGKGFNIEKLQHGLLEAKNYFHNNGQKKYRGHISMIVGLPYETEETLKETFYWIRDNWKGENASFFPLEIPFDSTKDKLSKLSEEYLKWGYREVDLSGELINHAMRQINHTLIWENDHMNYMRAEKLSSQLMNELEDSNEFGPSCMDLYLFGPLDESLKIRMSSERSIYGIVLQRFLKNVNDYKIKKLNM